MELENKRLEEDFFLVQRSEVLGHWQTGEDVNLDEAIKFHKALPKEKRMFSVLKEATEDKRTLIQPRAGVALVDEHIELLRYLQDVGEADLLPTTIDSYTRQNRYGEAEKGIQESRHQGRSLLNGFPAVNHGVTLTRRVVESLDRPLQVRHGTPDARLLAEITLAAGYTDFEGGAISYNIPYAKHVPLTDTIAHWQYVDRLVGLYAEKGVLINREPFGPLTGTLVPPAISHSIAIIEALLAVQQGVRALTIGYGQGGNLRQDIAALLTLDELGREYLSREGYDDILLTTVFHQWMGGFPQDEAKAFSVIAWGSVAAALTRTTKIIVKTPHEALGIPTKEANAQGLRATKQIINMLQEQTVEDTVKLQQEKEMIKAEVACILDKVLELGEGDWARGTVAGFEAGVLDVPFAPSKFNKGLTLPARDNEGAIRYLEVGNLPFSQDLKDMHRNFLEERGRAESRSPSFQMVIDDIYAVSKGRLVGRP